LNSITYETERIRIENNVSSITKRQDALHGCCQKGGDVCKGNLKEQFSACKLSVRNLVSTCEHETCFL